MTRASSEVRVDGRLEEEAWQDALSVELRFETHPGENIEPPVRTELLVTYDHNAFYAAFRAHDPNPDAIRAHFTDRDRAFNDDVVGIVLDTFNDERRAFEFLVNPLGVQMDLFNDDVSRREDESWDAIWESAGRITAEGFIVEMAIPFHQLRFPATDGPQTWGFDAMRSYPRNQRHRMSIHPLDRNVDCYLCQASKMVGFEGITPGRNLEVVPTLIAGRTDEMEGLSEEPLKEGEPEAEPGVTITWGLTSNLILSAAINPDFSQVEADVAQLDINRRFTLFFPERRPFFLEGADFFNTPFRAVFTRNIADPAWGLKVTGKQGVHGLGVFVAEDEVTNLLFPGNQDSEDESFDFPSTAAVARYRHDLGSASALGVLATSRSGKEYSNLVGGLDGLIRFGQSDSLSFQLLGSESRYPDSVAEEFDQPFGKFSDRAYLASYNHNSRNWRWEARYEDVGRDFRADMGFVPRVDFRGPALWAARVWWGQEEDWWTRLEVGTGWVQQEDQDGQFLEREVEVWGVVSGPRQSFLALNLSQEDEVFDGQTFDLERMRFHFGIQPSGDLRLRLDGRLGDSIDRDNTRPGDGFRLEPSIRLSLGRHFSVGLAHELRRLDVEEGRLFDANLTQLRLVYQFNVRMFVRLITQYTDIVRDPELYIDEVDAREELLFNQLLFSYKLNPQTVFFVGYTDTQEGNEEIDLTATNRTLFLKIGYAWVP